MGVGIGIVSALLALVPCGAVGNQDQGGEGAATAPPADAGKAAVESLSRLAPGEREESYFSIKHGPEEEIGYILATLEAKTANSELTYAYETETGIDFPSGARAKLWVTAKLHPTFEPIEVDLRRTMITMEGVVQRNRLYAKIGSDKVTLSSEADGKKTSNEAPCPERPFVYAIESMIAHLDFHTHDHFTVGEFDVSTGGARDLTFETEMWEDKVPAVLTFDANGHPSYHFWFDKQDKLIRWAEPSMPVYFVRTTKEHAEQLKETFEASFSAATNQPAPSQAP